MTLVDGFGRNVPGNVSSISACLLAAVHVPCHARLISLFSEWLCSESQGTIGVKFFGYFFLLIIDNYLSMLNFDSGLDFIFLFLYFFQ